MDLSNARRKGKQPYEAVREQFDQIGERVIERHWEADAPVRQGYRRFLGALDGLAGRLLDDDEIAQRSQDLLREDEAEGATAPDEAAADGTAETAGADGRDGNSDTGAAGEETAVTANESVWTQASEEADESGEAKVGESWAAGNARVAEENDQAREEPPAQTVDVVFSLPAETEAEHVALCGEFNDWSPEATSLSRGDDRSWRVTVPLAPGTYRYKFLLDGETWENGTDADRYEENAYGTTDSVIVVS